MDAKAQKIIADAYDGTLTASIKRNTSYAMTGFAAGALGGYFLASFMGASRFGFGAIGGIVFGLIGYAAAKHKTKKSE